MDPVEPWIDGDAVRRLAAQLLASPNDSDIAENPDAGFGPRFEGFTSGGARAEDTPRREMPAVESPALVKPVPVPRPESEAVDRVRDLPVEDESAKSELKKDEPVAKPFLAAEESGEGAEPKVAESNDQPFHSVSRPRADAVRDAGRGPLMERMLRFRDWLRRNASARSVFVLDRDGQPVLDDPAYAKLHFLARSLSQAYRPVPGQPGNVHVKVGSDSYLVVIPVDTAFGCLVLGTVLPSPLDAASVEVVSKALVDAAKPGRS
jgi:hypothetical protein